MTLKYQFIIALFLLLLPALGLAEPVYQEKTIKRILILYGMDKGHPAHNLTEKGIVGEFRANKQFNVQLYTEYLDLGRFPDLIKTRAMADFIRSKYKETTIDAIITVYPTALDFLRIGEKPLFPGVPVIAAEISRAYARDLAHSPERHRITGTIMGDNISGLMDTALRLLPAIKRVALITGTSPLDGYGDQLVREGLKPYSDRFELIELKKLPMSEILAKVATLPRDTIILYHGLVKDGAGQSFVPREALEQISRAANAPVFGIYDTYLDHGIIGGRLISFELQGKAAANLAFRVLAGEPPETIPFGGDQTYTDIYDWRELKRWQIPKNAIPVGSEIRFYQATFWEQYRWLIVGAVSFAIVETLLIVALVINLRRRKQAEVELMESRMRLDVAADSAGAGLWSIDAETGQIWATDRALEMYGFLPGDHVDIDKFLAIVHPEDRERIDQTIASAFRDHNAVSIEYRIILPDGAICWMAARGKTQQNQYDKAVSLLGASMNVTDRKQMELALQQKQRELNHVARIITMGQLTSTLAHELNQPLGAILRNAEAAELMLQERSPDLDELRAILRDICKDDQRAGSVIDRMRVMMKLRRVESCPLDFHLLMSESITLVQPDADKRRVSLTVNAEPTLPPANGDRILLQQVLINLLLNAMDAMNDIPPEKRLVTLSARFLGTTIEIAVCDNGYGIPEDSMPHLFEPFFTTKPEGLGMGLAISRGIVETHGGRLWAKNNETAGATFTISLPVAVQGSDI